MKKSLLNIFIASLVLLEVLYTPSSLVLSYGFEMFAPLKAEAATFNKQINYQGKLQTNTGVTVANGTYHMRFALYTVPTGGAAIWTEDRSTAPGDRVTITNGLFSVMLGSSTPLTSVDFNQTLYLGVEIGGSAGAPTWDGEMTPRKILGAVPAAFVADTLDGIDSTGFVQTNSTSTIATTSAQTVLTINQTGAGNLLDVQKSGISQLLVGPSGLTFTNATGTTIFNTTASSTNLFSTALTTGLITSGNINGQTISSAANFTGSLAVGSTFTATGGLSTLSNLLTTGSSTFQNITFLNSTSTNATTTSFFATTASSTNLFATAFNLGSGSIGSLNLGSLALTSALTVPNGGTGANTFGQGWIYSTGGTSALSASTSPTVNYITATSTTATSTFTGGLNVAGTTGLTVLQNGGRVGIGTTSPTEALTVSNPTNGGKVLSLYGTNNPVLAEFYVNNFSTFKFEYNGSEAAITGSQFVPLVLRTQSNQNIAFMPNGTGNVGIGTTSPYAKLSVVGEVVAANFTATTTANNTFPNLISTNSTTTNATTTNVNIAGKITGAGLSACALSSSKLLYDAATGLFSCGADAGAGGGLTALGAQYSTPQTGSTQTFATSSDTNIGLIITSSGDTHTFTPTWIGTLADGRVADNLTISGGSINNTPIGASSASTAIFTLSTTTSATTTNLFFTSANGGSITSTGLGTFANILTLGSTTLQNFTAGNSTSTNATTTSFFTTTGSTTNLYFTTANGGTQTLTGTLTAANIFATGSSTLQNFTFVNATGTSATTTNFFATNASSTNLFGSLMNIGSNALVVNSSGNVGIGTTTLGAKLVIQNQSGGQFLSLYSTTGSQERLAISDTGSITGGGGKFEVLAGNGIQSNSFGIGNILGGYNYSGAFGRGNTISSDEAFTFGKANTVSATLSAAFGLGITNNIASSVMIGPSDSAKITILSSGNVGIGTTSPYSKLSIWGGSVGKIVEAVTSASTTVFSVSATGFGTTTVSGLSIVGSATSTSNVGFNLSGGCFAIGGNCLTDNTASTTLLADNNTFTGANSFATLFTTGSSTLQNFTFRNATGTNATTTNFFATTASSTNLFSSLLNVGSNALVVDSSGNIAIGTSTATRKLEISTVSGGGTVNLFRLSNLSNTANTGAGIEFVTDNTGYIGSSIVGLRTSTAGPGHAIQFNLNSLEKARIDSNGNFGIGTTSPYTKLSVAGTVLADNFTATTTANNTFPNLLSTNSTTTNATTTNFFSTIASSTNLFATAANIGTLTLGTLNLSNALTVANGGTGASTFGQGWIYSTGGTSALAASTSPTVNYITATSTTGTSTFAGGLVAGGATGLSVLQNGNVGIGLVNPAYKFDINGDSRVSGDMYFGGSGARIMGDTNNIRLYDKNGFIILQSFPSGVSNSETYLKSSYSSLTKLSLLQDEIQLAVSDGGATNQNQDTVTVKRGFFGNIAATTKNLFKVTSTNYSALTNATTLRGIFVDVAPTDWSTVRAIETTVGDVIFNSTSGKVGIGTTSPYSKLSIWGDATGNIIEGINSASTTVFKVSATGFGTTTVAGLNISGSATSTSNVGFNLTGGCFAINGNCLSGSTASTTLLSDNNNFTGTNTFANLTFANATGTTIFNTTASSTNLFSTAFTTGLITSGNINGQTISSAANFTGSLAVGSTFTATGGLSTLSNLLVTGSSTLQNFTALNSTSTNATTTNFFSGTASTTNLFATNANLGNLTLTGALTIPNLLVNGSSTFQNVTFLNSTSTNATTTNHFSTTASSTNLFSTNANFGLSLLGNATSSNIFSGTASSTNLFSTALTTGLITSGNINGQTISSAANFTGSLTATGGLTTLSNLLATGSSTLQNFTALNSTSTNATTTTIFSGTASSTNLFSTNENIGFSLIGRSTTTNATTTTIFSGTASSTNLFATNANLGLVIYGNATGTAATTTNSFATTASSTNLFSTNANLGLLTLGNGTSTNFFSNTASSTNLFSTALTTGLITSGLINGQNISSAANFTGTLTATGGLTTLSNLLATGSSTLQNFTALNSTTTNATTTTIFSTTASSTNLFSTNENIGFSLIGRSTTTAATTTNLFSSIASSTSLFSTNANLGLVTYGNATGTAMFNTTASSTNLFSTNANLGLLTLGNGTSTNFFSNTASSTNLFSTALTTGLITSGLINGQTISSAANFTGSLTTASFINSQTGTNVGEYRVGGTTALSAASAALLSINSGGFTNVNISGNVGIGSTSPFAKLSVKGTGTGTGYSFQTTDSSNNPNFTILDNGNVGIGTTTPLAKLQIGTAPTGFSTLAIISGSSAGADVNALSLANSATPTINNSASINFNLGQGYGVTATVGATLTALGGISDLAFSTYNGSLTEKMRITSTGNVGIGSTSPSSKLSVFAGATDTYQPSLLTVASSTAAYATSTLFTVLANGNVGIGVPVPTVKLQINDTSTGFTAPEFAIVRDGGNTGGIGLYANSSANALNGGMILGGARTRGSTAVPDYTINGDGLFMISAGGWNGSFTDNTNGARIRFLADGNWNSGSSPTMIQFGLNDGSSNSNGEAIIPLTLRASGKVGIGTTSPFAKLSVTGGGTGTGAALQIADSANSPKFTVLDNGNVGIGTTTPAYKLTINSSNGTDNFFQIASTTNQNIFTITSSGNVGIGTNSPFGQIDIYSGLGEANFYLRSDYAGIRFASDTGGRNYIQSFGPSFAGSADLNFTGPFGSAFKMIIKASGNVGIGTSTPFARLAVTGSSTDATNAFVVSDSGNNSLFNVFNNGNIGVSSSTPWGKLSIEQDTTNPAFVVGNNGSSTPSLFVGGVNQNGFVGLGTTTVPSLARLVIDQTLSASGSQTAVAGMHEIYTFNPTADNTTQIGNRLILQNQPGSAATNTAVAQLIRVVDNTSRSNLVRGLEVVASAGTDTYGVNTGIRGTGHTFGLQGITTGLAGGTSTPAAIYGENTGTTQGDILRLYTSTMTTATSVAQFYQETSTFSGTGLLMNFGKGGGSFTGNYLDFQKNDNTQFRVASTGDTFLGQVGQTSTKAGLQIGYGGICVDNDGTCTASTTGRITAREYNTAGADLAESYYSDEQLQPGDIVYTKGSYSIGKAATGSDPIIGVVSTRPGMTLGTGEVSFSLLPEYPVGLTGRVPVKLSTENGPIAIGDKIVLSSVPGVGMKADPKKKQTTIGIALEAFDGSNALSDGTIEVNTQKVVTGTTCESKTVSGDEKLSGGVGIEGSGGSVSKSGTETNCIDQTTEVAPDSGNAETTTTNEGTTVKIGAALVFLGIERTQLTAKNGEANLAEVFNTDISLENHKIINVNSIASLTGKWSIDENGVLVVDTIKAKHGSFDEDLQVGTSAKPTGITIYDSATGNPYCLSIRNGAMASLPGVCVAGSVTNSSTQNTHQTTTTSTSQTTTSTPDTSSTSTSTNTTPTTSPSTSDTTTTPNSTDTSSSTTSTSPTTDTQTTPSDQTGQATSPSTSDTTTSSPPPEITSTPPPADSGGSSGPVAAQ